MDFSSEALSALLRKPKNKTGRATRHVISQAQYKALERKYRSLQAKYRKLKAEYNKLTAGRRRSSLS